MLSTYTSTPLAYAALDEKYSFFEHPMDSNASVVELIDLWKNDALGASCSCFYNIFENVIPKENRDVDTIKCLMHQSGAMRALMSGSGPAVFGIFETLKEAEEASSLLQQNGFKSFVCHPRGAYNE